MRRPIGEGSAIFGPGMSRLPAWGSVRTLTGAGTEAGSAVDRAESVCKRLCLALESAWIRACPAK